MSMVACYESYSRADLVLAGKKSLVCNNTAKSANKCYIQAVLGTLLRKSRRHQCKHNNYSKSNKVTNWSRVIGLS